MIKPFNKFAFAILLGGLAFSISSAHAMKHQSSTIKKKAYFTKSNGDLFEALDLKKKTVRFSPADFNQCGRSMLRRQKSLYYSCTLKLPSTAKISKLREQISPSTMNIIFGGSQKTVRVKIDQAAKRVSFSTRFDDTGVDFEVSRFNDEFFKVYSKVAQLIIAEAMDQKPLVYQVLESN